MWKRIGRIVLPLAILLGTLRPGARPRTRAMFGSSLLAFWSAMYLRYRKAGIEQTHREYELLKRVNWQAFWRHYNERVPTVEQELDLWGDYHRHRHEMRYDLVARAVRRHLPPGGRVLDVGCGAGLVADRILDLNAEYVGFDFGGPHIEYAAKKFAELRSPLQVSLVRCDGERTPFADVSMDVVVMSEVIEHLLRPELAVWEIARVLRPGGIFIMTTNNASEMPLRGPQSHLFAWIEKALGADRPSLISLRPWIWPEPVDPELLPEGSPEIYLPHTHHIQEETRRMFAAAGMETFHWSTFEFPPPQSATAGWLERRGAPGRRTVDVIEWASQRTPLVRRLGTHLFMLARKTGEPVATQPPAGIWPGPLSGDSLR
jgi:ubiquinone/menaquinone biosynthesis C-methylase UbiE